MTPFPVEVRALSKTYGGRAAVCDVSFEATPGHVVGLLGPNGSGKSTTLRMLLGLVRPDGGSARVCGRPYAALRNPGREVGALLDAAGLQPGRSARQHLAIVAMSVRMPMSRADELLALVGLESDANRRLRDYSLGMKQRLGIATALMGDPDLLILDEPANGLDPAGVHWLRGMLRDFVSTGRTVLMASHVLPEVAHVVDEIVVLDHGQVAAQGDLPELTGSRSLEDYYLALTGGFGDVQPAVSHARG